MSHRCDLWCTWVWVVSSKTQHIRLYLRPKRWNTRSSHAVWPHEKRVLDPLHDFYETPMWAWMELQDAVPSLRRRKLWDPFYCKGATGAHWTSVRVPHFVCSRGDFFRQIKNQDFLNRYAHPIKWYLRVTVLFRWGYHLVAVDLVTQMRQYQVVTHCVTVRKPIKTLDVGHWGCTIICYKNGCHKACDITTND